MRKKSFSNESAISFYRPVYLSRSYSFSVDYFFLFNINVHIKSMKISRDYGQGIGTTRDRSWALPHFPALPQSIGISEPQESHRKGLLRLSCTFRKRSTLYGHINTQVATSFNISQWKIKYEVRPSIMVWKNVPERTDVSFQLSC